MIRVFKFSKCVIFTKNTVYTYNDIISSVCENIFWFEKGGLGSYNIQHGDVLE